MKRDAYGGFLEVSSKASGFFRLEQIDGRWWFITPDGHGFIATGFNHANQKWFQASYNKEHWRHLFESPQKFEDMVIADAKAWNMTAVGYGGVRSLGKFPYFFRITFPGPSNWMLTIDPPDMFSSDFEKACQTAVERDCSAHVDDPWLIGYSFNDCPEWPILDRVSKRRPRHWIDHIKAMGPESAGKQRYVSLMRDRHEGIESFNFVYGTTFGSFEEILPDAEFIYAVPNRPDVRRSDDEAFLELMAERYLDVAHKAVRNLDRNHLILGEIYDGNRGIPPQVMKAASKRFDVLSTQFYGYFDDQAATLEQWHSASGLPIFLADSCFNCLDEPLPEVVSPRVKDQAERAQAFVRYAHQSLAVPYVVGWIWCGYIDGSTELEARRQHQGIMNAWGRKHEPLSSAMTSTFAETYALATAARR